jgi:hypothetical protein
VALEDSLERFPDGAESLVVEARFGEDRREAPREEQGVAFSQRQAQRFGEADNHCPARLLTALAR